MNSLTGNLQMWAIALALGCCTSAALAEESAPSGEGMMDTPGEYIRDYLSDPRRTGSLAGGILGGALSAHPAGPMVGSLIGFFVGKRSMFKEEEVQAQQARANQAQRAIVPGSNQAMPTLSMTDTRGISFAGIAPATSAQRINPAALAAPSLSGPTLLSREQIAAMCSGQAVMDARLRSLCFYKQGG